MPGAFETKYQVAPLDMFDETFRHAREDLIKKRMEEIRNGEWRHIAERHDAAHRAKKTWCIGVSWDLCSKEDLLDILEVCKLSLSEYVSKANIVLSVLGQNRWQQFVNTSARITKAEVAEGLIYLSGRLRMEMNLAFASSSRSKGQAIALKQIKEFGLTAFFVQRWPSRSVGSKTLTSPRRILLQRSEKAKLLLPLERKNPKMKVFRMKRTTIVWTPSQRMTRCRIGRRKDNEILQPKIIMILFCQNGGLPLVQDMERVRLVAERRSKQRLHNTLSRSFGTLDCILSHILSSTYIYKDVNRFTVPV